MSDSGDVEARLSAVEQELARLRAKVAEVASDAAAARVLAGGADRDVSELGDTLRSHTQVLNALRETQLEHGQRLTSLDGRVADLDERMTRGFATLGEGMARIHGLLSRIAPDGDED